MVNLLRHLRRSLGIACFFISHDLRLAACLCDRIGVLAGGSIAAIGKTSALMGRGAHPGAGAVLPASRTVM